MSAKHVSGPRLMEPKLTESRVAAVPHHTPAPARLGAPGAVRPTASANFTGPAGEQGLPPRLNYFVSRSIGRPEATQSWSLQSLPESQTEKLPAQLTEKYILRRLLGRGSFGTVRSVIDRQTGLEWAAKIMPKSVEGKDPTRLVQRLKEEVRFSAFCHIA